MILRRRTRIQPSTLEQEDPTEAPEEEEEDQGEGTEAREEEAEVVEKEKEDAAEAGEEDLEVETTTVREEMPHSLIVISQMRREKVMNKEPTLEDLPTKGEEESVEIEGEIEAAVEESSQEELRGSSVRLTAG